LFEYILTTNIAHNYEIHSQKEMHSIDMHFHMRRWLTMLDHYFYVDGKSANDYIFPGVSGSGSLQAGSPVSHDTIQKWLDEFVAAAGIGLGNTKLTTHCLRRGGAQYRFMFAKVGKRWSLATVRWWGGWAEGEHVGIILDLKDS
jgi:integrase